MFKKIAFSVVSLVVLLSAKATLAFCPVCTVAVIGGLGLSRWLGIDDTISGVWIGGLTVSMIGWTIDWFNRKHWRFKGRKIAIALFYYALIVLPLYFIKDIWHPLNTVWGINKLLLGIISGSIFFFAAGMWYNYLKAKNNNRPWFKLQKVVWPISALIILSLVFYFVTR